MFSVKVDLDRAMFETTIEGFWSLDDVTAFGRAVTDAARRIVATGRSPVSLCDYTGAAVQSQPVIAAFQRMMENPVIRTRRVAMYTASVLPRMQAMRVTRSRLEIQYFTDRAEAERWLFAPE